jgi:hypothetical protein
MNMFSSTLQKHTDPDLAMFKYVRLGVDGNTTADTTVVTKPPTADTMDEKRIDEYTGKLILVNKKKTPVGICDCGRQDFWNDFWTLLINSSEDNTSRKLDDNRALLLQTELSSRSDIMISLQTNIKLSQWIWLYNSREGYPQNCFETCFCLPCKAAAVIQQIRRDRPLKPNQMPRAAVVQIYAQ